MRTTTIVAAALLSAASGLAPAQSLFQQMLDGPAAPGGRDQLRVASMYLVDPPAPRTFAIHDIIYVIINENSRATSRHRLLSNKQLQKQNDLNGIIDPFELLELRLQGSDIDSLSLLDLQSRNQFIGDGQYNRDDQFIARIAAEVIDVKPNGNLVLQAKKSVGQDGEDKVMILSGVARQDDVTDANTLLSSQLADLRVDVEHSGELRETAKKGFLTRALEAIFNF